MLEDLRCRVLEVKNSARRFTDRLRRRVYQQRTHQNYTATINSACDRGDSVRHGVDLGIAEHTQGVSAGKHSERTVLLGGVVKMETNGNDARQRVRGSVCIKDSGFRRPRSPTHNIAPFEERQCRILVPHNQPVGSR